MVRLECDVPDLEVELQALLAQIPRGRVTTYGDLADALGTRSAARWVGEFLRQHDHDGDCACHRVVRKGGELGLYLANRNRGEKSIRLAREGLRITHGIVERFEERAFRDFVSDRPLTRLIEFQESLAQRVVSVPLARDVKLAAGLDVSYSRDGRAIGACALMDCASSRIVWSTTRRLRVCLPYIPGLLAFRELPVLLALFDEARRQRPAPDVYLVDGNGILHPRGAGIATCFGVLADVPTIGVAKSLLCGRLDEESKSPGAPRPVIVNERVAGLALRFGRTSRPIFVSPGQKIDVDGAGRRVAALHRDHRLPEPLYWADRLSRAESRRVATGPVEPSRAGL